MVRLDLSSDLSLIRWGDFNPQIKTPSTLLTSHKSNFWFQGCGMWSESSWEQQSTDWKCVCTFLFLFSAKAKTRSPTAWADEVQEEEEDTGRIPGRGVHMHEKLSSPSRKRSVQLRPWMVQLLLQLPGLSWNRLCKSQIHLSHSPAPWKKTFSSCILGSAQLYGSSFSVSLCILPGLPRSPGNVRRSAKRKHGNSERGSCRRRQRGCELWPARWGWGQGDDWFLLIVLENGGGGGETGQLIIGRVQSLLKLLTSNMTVIIVITYVQGPKRVCKDGIDFKWWEGVKHSSMPLPACLLCLLWPAWLSTTTKWIELRWTDAHLRWNILFTNWFVPPIPVVGWASMDEDDMNMECYIRSGRHLVFKLYSTWSAFPAPYAYKPTVLSFFVFF